SPHPCRCWRCPRPREASGGRSDKGMHEGNHMGIMTTLKKPTAERGEGGRGQGTFAPLADVAADRPCQRRPAAVRGDRPDPYSFIVAHRDQFVTVCSEKQLADHCGMALSFDDQLRGAF